MRVRERFIIWSALLGVAFWSIQLVPIHFRYQAIIGFALLTYLSSALVLRHTISWRHWLLFLPIPAIYSLIIGAFYFLLPTNLWSLII